MPASQQTPADVPTLDQLKARRAAGEAVTVDEWARARAKAELDEVDAILAAQAAAEQAEAERLDIVRQIKARVLDAGDKTGHADDIAAITAAVSRILTREAERAATVSDAMRELVRLGILGAHLSTADRQKWSERRGVEAHTELDGVSWSEAIMGRGACVVIDGQAVTTSSTAGPVLADAIMRGLAQARQTKAALAPALQINRPMPS